MQERLLQFIWQFKYFNTRGLSATNGETLLLLDTGQLNTNQGPDFLQAKIKIENTLLAGNIELHVKTSDWYTHRHEQDKAYQNIILHVVWQHDMEIEGATFPTLELQHLVASSMLQQYESLMHHQGFVPCDKFLPAIPDLQWIVWKDRLLVERLEKRSLEVLQLMEQTKGDWAEIFWQLVAKSFGVKINADAFFWMAKSLPLRILAKHKNQLVTLEALLLGQSGLLTGTLNDAYPKMLGKEYYFLAKKYRLQAIERPPVFLRMRPANFPTVRLSQLAALVYSSNHLFSKIKEAETCNELSAMFTVRANDYWHQHYTLYDDAHTVRPKALGRNFIDTLLINTVIPIVFTYGQYTAQEGYKEKALRWLTEIKAEQNNITRGWEEAGIACTAAFDSQALIELKNNYCDKKKCLDCAIGNRILKN